MPLEDSMTFGKKNGNIDREAFRAVMRDDAEVTWQPWQVDVL